MTVSLRKGQGVSLRKNEFDLSSVTIGLGWDINEEKKGFLGGIFGKKEEEYDLDVIAFLCNAAGKVTNLAMLKMVSRHWLTAISSSSTVFAINQADSVDRR